MAFHFLDNLLHGDSKPGGGIGGAVTSAYHFAQKPIISPPHVNIPQNNVVNKYKQVEGTLLHFLSPDESGQGSPNLNQRSLGRQYQSFKDTSQAYVTRPIAEGVASLRDNQFTYHPGSTVEKQIFGETPIQNIQKKTVNTYDTHSSLPTWQRLFLAGGEAAASTVQDIPSVKVLAVGGKGLIKRGLTEAEMAARPYRMTDYEAHVINKVKNGAGTIGAFTPAENKVARVAMQRNHLNPDDPNAMSKVVDSFRHYNTQKQKVKDINAKGGVDKLGLSTQDTSGNLVDEVAAHYKTADAFLKDTAAANYKLDKSLTGGQKIKTDTGYARTSEHTPFYRQFFANHDRPPSQADYQEAIRQEFQTGQSNLAHPDEHAIYKKLMMQDLAKTNEPAKVNDLLQQSHPDVAQQVAPGATLTKDPLVVDRMINQARNPATLEDLPKPATPPPAPPPSAAEAGKEEAINKFLQTVRSADTTTPELKKEIQNLQQTHEVRSTDKLANEAAQAVEKDYRGTLVDVMSADNPNDKQIAQGIQLIVKAQKDNRIDEAVNIAEHLDKKLREQGRSVQAASIMGRLSPEGILRQATKQIRTVREAKPGRIKKENKFANELQQQVESTKPTEAKVKKTVEELTTGQKVAKKVEREVTPQVKKQADTLVNEITKKIKQEMLAPKEQVRKSPTDVLREVFGRNQEAQAAFPEAQNILRKKFADNPEALDKLDKFFKSELGLPAADKTISGAIREQLAKNGDRISQVIYKSHVEQGKTVEQTASDLVKEGFDSESAKDLAEEVTNRLNSGLSEAKQSVLERLRKDTPERNQSTVLEKINKLSNLGALDSKDYLDVARARLGHPYLSTETAAKISKLSQKIQSLPEGHDKYAAVRQISNLISESVPKSYYQYAKEIPVNMRTILASGDFSFGGRQALAYATAHPVQFARLWQKQFRFFGEAFMHNESKAFDAMQADIRNHPDYNLLERSPLAIIEPHNRLSSAREERFMATELADKVPGLRNVVEASNYAYTGLANSIRANQFYGMIEQARAADRELDKPLIDDIAKVINNGTGRGSLGKFEQQAGLLSSGLFAPRLIASRVNTLNPAYYVKLDPLARREAVRQLLGLSAFGTSVLGLASMAGLDVGVDPRSSDFGKIKVGDTRVDILGGYSQYIRLGAQLIKGERVNSTTGEVATLGKGFVGSRWDSIVNFFSNKANPAVSLGIELAKGKDINGNDIWNPKGISTAVAQRFIPLLAQDVNDLRTHPEHLNPAIAAPLGLFGAGIQTYGTQDTNISAHDQAFIDRQHLDAKGNMALTRFFQTSKELPTKANAYTKVDAALKNNDYNGAYAAAKDYNAKVEKTYAPWVKQYGDKYGNQDLYKYYSSQFINPDSFTARLDKSQNPTL